MFLFGLNCISNLDKMGPEESMQIVHVFILRQDKNKSICVGGIQRGVILAMLKGNLTDILFSSEHAWTKNE